MAETAGTKDWSALLAETRQALANLRAEDLEELAARAQSMFDAAAASEPAQRRGTPGLAADTRAQLVQEHRLLGDLLAATDRNLEVLRRLRGRLRDPAHAGEVHSQWVR